MAWESRKNRGAYYTRSYRAGGRVRREYVGTGLLGEYAAGLDETEKGVREQRRRLRLEEEERLEAAGRTVGDVCDQVEVIFRAALITAGYHQHDRGQWRKRRGERD